MGQVKHKLLKEQDSSVEDQEPDFDSYALQDYFDTTICITEKNDYIEWEKIYDDGIYCTSCKYNKVTKDAYGTGDSPTSRECTIYNIGSCPGLS